MSLLIEGFKLPNAPSQCLGDQAAIHNQEEDGLLVELYMSRRLRAKEGIGSATGSNGDKSQGQPPRITMGGDEIQKRLPRLHFMPKV